MLSTCLQQILKPACASQALQGRQEFSGADATTLTETWLWPASAAVLAGSIRKLALLGLHRFHQPVKPSITHTCSGADIQNLTCCSCHRHNTANQMPLL